MTDGFEDPDFPASPDDDFDNDVADIHVDFSDQEAASKALEALPTGKYHARIAKVTLKKSQSEKNFGKPMYNIEFRVVEGPYEGRPIYTNVMLWAGAAYSLNQLMNATGFSTKQGTNRVPRPEELIDKELMVRGIKKPAEGNYDERYEVKGMMPLKTGAAAGGATSLEP